MFYVNVLDKLSLSIRGLLKSNSAAVFKHETSETVTMTTYLCRGSMWWEETDWRDWTSNVDTASAGTRNSCLKQQALVGNDKCSLKWHETVNQWELYDSLVTSQNDITTWINCVVYYIINIRQETEYDSTMFSIHDLW